MKKIKYILLFFLAFLHISKPNEFRQHLITLMEEEIRSGFSEKSHMRIETNDEIEKNCFFELYKNEIMHHHKTNKIEVITFDKYNKQDEWDECDENPTCFASKLQNLKNYKSQNPQIRSLSA